MEKTAMQELKDWLNTPDGFYLSSKLDDKIDELIEKEKKQIIDAGNECISKWCLHNCERHGNEMPSGEQYYNQTYPQK